MSRFRIRSRAASLLTSGADYLATRDWQAASGSIRRSRQSSAQQAAPPDPRTLTTSATLQRFKDMSGRSGPENVVLLPGWVQRTAARDRFPQTWGKEDAPEDLEDGEIELHVSLHGFVSKALDTQSRSQRIFNQMARQLAGLPKLQIPGPVDESLLDPATTLTDEPQSIEASVGDAESVKEHKHRPEKLAAKLVENADDEALVRMMENLNAFPTETAAQDRPKIHHASTSSTMPERKSSMAGGSIQWESRSVDDIAGFHHNLNQRLKAYWIYRSPHKDVLIEVSPVIGGEVARDSDGDRLVLASTRLTTDATGQFEYRLVVPWHMLTAFCQHYASVIGATPNRIEAVEVRAQLVDHRAQVASSDWRRLLVQEDGARKVRVISDIDDTVKQTGVLQGAKQILRNVFVLPYHESEVQGVAAWYHSMIDLDVGLHYVTNAPLELYSLVLDFLHTVRLPVSHLVLKHYPSGARSLFSSWLEPAGERKRSNILRILDDFRSSQFLLIGDSGELDLELYCQLAAERPWQIRGVFIRDVSTPRSSSSNKSATALSASSITNLPRPPQTVLKPPSASSSTFVTSRDSPAFFDTSYPPKPASALDLPADRFTARSDASQHMSEAEMKRAQTFQSRLTRSTSMLPRSTVFRLFRHGGDVQDEALQLIRELQSGTRPAERTR